MIPVRIFNKIFAVIAVILCLPFMVKAQDLDSLQQKALSDKLEEYFAAIEREGVQVQQQECDFLIDSAADSLVRQFIALKAYDHYLNSPVMGSEAVAVYIVDTWFIPGKVRMKNDVDLLNARVFADFNRQSLVGMQAPQLTLHSLAGEEVSLFLKDDAIRGQRDRFSILYFYDTDCSKCKIETILLRNILEDNDFPVNLIAVYAGDDRASWEEYASRQLSIESDEVMTVHLWDPELDSDFQRKYGVLQTPRIFLIRPDGTIMGRGLDVEALYLMLRNVFADVQLTYGSDESVQLFDGILASDNAPVSADRVKELAGYISSSTLPKGDTLMFRQLSGDLLYYLATRSGEGVKEGLKHLIETNIYGQPEVWDSADDSLKVIGFADIMDDLLSKAEIGTPVPGFKVPAQKITCRGPRNGTFRLNRLKGSENIIVFFTEGCELCAAEKNAIRQIASDNRKVVALFVNVDEILASAPSLADELFDSFDLSSLPYIILTDRKGLVVRRYLSYR